MMERANTSLTIPAPAHAASVLSYRQASCELGFVRGDVTVLAERRMR
jgi:hypothetical protein